VKSLAATGPKSIEADIAIAAASIEATDWEGARAVLQPHLANRPTARICLLMARIEAGQHRDTGRAREWMARAARGASDPLWVAADGSLSKQWRPVSASGALGAFEWKVPPAEGTSGEGDDLWAAITAAPEVDLSRSTGEPMETRRAAEVVEIEPVEVTPPEREASKPATPSVPSTGKSGPVHEITILPPDRASTFAAKPLKPEHDGLANGTPPAQELRAKPGGDQPEAQDNGASSTKALPAEGRPKLLPRSPTIFISGRPPDDPGPRDADLEEASTPLSRFRQPH
jgi:HemY protein